MAAAAVLRLGGELVDLADLLVEQSRRRAAAQLADAPRERPGRVSQLRSWVGRRGDDGLADYRWFVAALDRVGDQCVDVFAALRGRHVEVGQVLRLGHVLRVV